MKATVKHPVFTHNGEHDLHIGDIVDVDYYQEIWCQMRGKMLPVYIVYGLDGFFHGHMYSTGLTIETPCAP